MPLTAVIRLRGGKGSHKLSVDLIDPKGRSAFPGDTPAVEFECTPERGTDIAVKGTAKAKIAGTYQFVVLINGRKTGHSVELQVKKGTKG